MQRNLQCHCGERTFTVRLDRNEAVGLVTCLSAKHDSLLLDSRDYWLDLIQNGKPREIKCHCKSNAFTASLIYRVEREREAISAVDLNLRCVACGVERLGMTFEIDYEPTDQLVDQPLHPCPNPWLKPKRVSITALWKPYDLLRFGKAALAYPESRAYLVKHGEGQPVPVNDYTQFEFLCTSQASEAILTNTGPPSLDRTRRGSRDHPELCVSCPTTMTYPTGTGHLYYIEYAKQIVQGMDVVAQPDTFLDFAEQMTIWLKEHFISTRGRNTADNPAEFSRLRGNGRMFGSR